MRTRNEHDGNSDNAMSDDESFMQELENISTRVLRSPRVSDKKGKLGANNSPVLNVDVDSSKPMDPQRQEELKVCCSPLLSPNEELTLLMVKNKPNGPDFNPDEELAPMPPRSNHDRSSRTSTSSSSKVSTPQQQFHEKNSPQVTTFVDPTTGDIVHGDAPTPRAASVIFSYHDPDLSSIDESGHLRVSQSPGVESGSGILAVEAKGSKSQTMAQSHLKISSNDSGTTATPATLLRRIHGNEEDMQVYTTNYIPSRLNPSSSTENTTSYATSAESSLGAEGLVKVYNASDDQESCEDTRNISHPSNRHKSQASIESISYQEELGFTESATSSEQEESAQEFDTMPQFSISSATIQSRSDYLQSHHQVDGMKEAQRYKNGETALRDVGRSPYTSSTDRKLEHDHGRDWSRWLVYCIGCCLIVGITVGFAVYFSTNDKKDEANLNIDCQNALKLTNVLGGTMLGEIIPNGQGNAFSSCQIEQEEGYALWYYVDGDGQPMRATTCGTETLGSLDSQVMVLVGSCGSLECIGGSDQLCGSHGSVGWLAEKDTRYFIVVKGSQSTDLGQFLLTVETVTPNDMCGQAKTMGTNDSPLFGSTRNATVDERLSVCEGRDAKIAASWFQLHGDGSIMCASVSTETSQKPNFPVILSVLHGIDCDDLNCTGQALPRDDEPWTTADIAFVAEEGQSYYVVVSGEDNNLQGDFVLDVYPTPPNGLCERADTISPGAASNKGTMMNACKTKSSQCAGSLDIPGVWYQVVGTGEILIAHTIGLSCHDNGGNQSQVSIFKSGDGGCSQLQCVEYLTAPCTADNNKVITQWFSDVGATYFVLIQSSYDSEFEISIEEFLPGGSSNCSAALTVPISGVATVGSTVNATPTDLGDCFDPGAKGVWYVVEGTGSTLEASTCNAGTNFPTNITILSGTCATNECVSSKTVTCDDMRSIAYWETVLGQKYFVYVHGQTESDVGLFALTVQEKSLGVENDFCGSAESLIIPSTNYGSTIYATNDDEYAILCDNAAAAPGVWYTVVGEGRLITASLCGAATQYDSQIHVFVGNSCGELTCLDFNEDGCGVKSMLSWKALEGQKYYILVSGFSNAVGEFELIVK